MPILSQQIPQSCVTYAVAKNDTDVTADVAEDVTADITDATADAKENVTDVTPDVEMDVAEALTCMLPEGGTEKKYKSTQTLGGW